MNNDRECTDVTLVVRQYDASLSSLLNKHAPSKLIYVVERPMNDWMTDDILVLKALRRKYESLWRKTRLTVHFDMYSGSCMDIKAAISKSTSEIFQKKITDCNGDQKKLFKLVHTLRDPGMSLNCAPTRVCRKSASRPGYVVKVRTDPGYVVKQCPRIVMNKIFDWH